MYPLTDLARGAKTYAKGVVWLKNHPFYLGLLMVPTLVALFGMLGAGALFVHYHAELQGFFLTEPKDGWFRMLLYFLSLFVFYVAAVIAVLLIGAVLSNLLASPIYESISQAIEREFKPGQAIELSFWQSLKLFPEELKKILLVGILSLVLFIIPGLNLLALFGTAWLVAWDFYDYPLARRGMRLKERLKLAGRDMWSIMGLGLWFLIPILQLILVPMAVVGGTLLSLERLPPDNMHKEATL